MTQGRKTRVGTLVGYFTEQEQGQKSLLELYHRGFRWAALVHKTADRDVQTCDLFPWRRALGAIVTAHAHCGVRNAACATVAIELQAEVRQSSVLDSDETGARVDGRTWWEWVLVTASVVLHCASSDQLGHLRGLVGSSALFVLRADEAVEPGGGRIRLGHTFGASRVSAY